MKRIFQLTVSAFALASAPLAQAWTYSDGDVLLIFRDGLNDVEFDLGNISQFTGKSNGYTTVVTNWSYNLVTNTFGADLTGAGVTVALVASTSSAAPNPTAWLSGSEPNTTAYNPSSSGWGNLYGTINSVGISPKIYAVPTNSFPQSHVIRAAGSGTASRYKYASYDYIVSGGTYNALPYLGGGSPFIVEQGVPGTLDFWAIEATGASPAPPDNLVGTFSITADGVLTFVAGAPPASVLGIVRSNGVNTVTFTTRVGGTYQLASANSLQTPRAAWPVLPSSVAGDGRNKSLSDTNSADVGFYGVQRSP